MSAELDFYIAKSQRSDDEIARLLAVLTEAKRCRDNAENALTTVTIERDAMREVLEQIESILVRGDKTVSYMLMKIREVLK